MRALAVLAAAGLAACSALRPPPLLFIVERKLPNCRIKPVGPGVVYAKWNSPNGTRVHVVAFAVRNKKLSLKPILASGRIRGLPKTRETLFALGRRSKALALVSAGALRPGYHVAGLTVIDGRVQFAPKPPQRSSLVVGRDFKPWFGRFDPDRDTEPEYFQAISGGPMLVEDGQAVWKVEEDGVVNGDRLGGKAGTLGLPRAQTAVGATQDGGRFFLVFVEGPDEDIPGMTPRMVGELMVRLGCDRALRLAAGPGAGMVLRGRRLGPGEGQGPRIGAALALFAAR